MQSCTLFGIGARRLLLVTVTLAFCAMRCPAQSTLPIVPDNFSWVRGANYVPSYARNDVQMWLDYDSPLIDRELGYAERLKLNTVRVFLNQLVYERQPAKFLADFEDFLALCDKHHIKVMPVLFDSCFDPQSVDLDKYAELTWIPSPGFDRIGTDGWPASRKYIHALIGAHKDDPRIVLWDVMNEPEGTAHYNQPEGRAKINDFLRRALKEVRDQGASQPLGIGWATSRDIIFSIDLSDVILWHNYGDPAALKKDILDVKEIGRVFGKPVILNEFVGRPQQRIEDALPVVSQEKVGWVFWELMLGETQFTQGKLPYQGHVYPDGTVRSASEAAAILHPEGFGGNAGDVAAAAGFKVRVPKTFSEAGITFSPRWERWNGAGPTGNRLWYADDANESAAAKVEGTRVTVVLKHGPDCGIAAVTVDGERVADIDTYSPQVDWNVSTTVAEALAAGGHSVRITVTGRKAAASSGNYVQIVGMHP